MNAQNSMVRSALPMGRSVFRSASTWESAVSAAEPVPLELRDSTRAAQLVVPLDPAALLPPVGGVPPSGPPAAPALPPAPPLAEPPVLEPAALPPPVAEPPATLTPPVAEPPGALAPPLAEPPAALAPPVGWSVVPPAALAPPVGWSVVPPAALAPPVGWSVVPPAALAPPVACSVDPPVAEVLLAPLLPPLALLPPVLDWVDPPDGLGWLLVLELQPRPTPAAHNSPKAAITSKRNFDFSISPVRIAFTFHKGSGPGIGDTPDIVLFPQGEEPSTDAYVWQLFAAGLEQRLLAVTLLTSTGRKSLQTHNLSQQTCAKGAVQTNPVLQRLSEGFFLSRVCPLQSLSCEHGAVQRACVSSAPMAPAARAGFMQM
jgi:hypothetical protein